MRILVCLMTCCVAQAGRALFAQPPPERVAVSGAVIDGVSGKPVPHAVVEIAPEVKSATRVPVGGNMQAWAAEGGNKVHSDAHGRFRFENILESDYLQGGTR